MHGVRQDQLLRNIQHAAAFWQVGVDAWVSLKEVGKPHLVLGGEVFQRLFVIVRNGDDLILADNTATVGRQRIRHR